jgi:hypothetical protein
MYSRLAYVGERGGLLPALVVDVLTPWEAQREPALIIEGGLRDQRLVRATLPNKISAAGFQYAFGANEGA